MKYLTTIITLLVFNIFAVVALLYFGNSARFVEEENKKILVKISKYNEQLKINEAEYTLYHNFLYLKKLQKIYFDSGNQKFSSKNRISLNYFKNEELQNVYKISSNK